MKRPFPNANSIHFIRDPTNCDIERRRTHIIDEQALYRVAISMGTRI
jgi:hypothetical protein